jgi:Ca2+-dependent lipid-binding protein
MYMYIYIYIYIYIIKALVVIHGFCVKTLLYHLYTYMYICAVAASFIVIHGSLSAAGLIVVFCTCCLSYRTCSAAFSGCSSARGCIQVFAVSCSCVEA